MNQRQCVRCGTVIEERVGRCPSCRAPVVATTGDATRVNEVLAAAAREQWLADAPMREEEASSKRRSRADDGNIMWVEHQTKARRARRNAVLTLVAGVLALFMAFLASSADDDAIHEIDFRTEAGDRVQVECRSGVAVVGDAEADAACADQEPPRVGATIAPFLAIGGLVLVAAGGVLLLQTVSTGGRKEPLF